MMNSLKLFSVLVAVFCVYGGFVLTQTTDGYEVVCPDEESVIPHWNCSLYYQCANGIPYLQECSIGLYFNPATGQCDYPDEVRECDEHGTNRPPIGSTTTTTPIPTTTTTPTTTTPTPTTTTPTPTTTTPTPTTTTPTPSTTTPTTTTTTTTEEPPFCPPTGVEDFPYPGNCSLFIRCIGGQPFIEQCADGLHFDKIDKVCKLVGDAVCDDLEEPPTTTSEPPEFTCPDSGIETFPHLTNCSQYYLCTEGHLLVQTCAFGLYYDAAPNVKQCNFAETATCDSECPEDGIHYRPIRTAACDYYKVCFNGSSVNLRCAEGTRYHPVEQRCVHVDSYTCPYAGFESLFL